MINLNQLRISKQVGDYASLPANPAEEVVIDSTVVGSVGISIPVVLSSMQGEMTAVKPAAITQVPYGVIRYSINKSSYVAYDTCSLATANDIIYMQTTAAAVAVGDKLEFNAAGQVLKSAGTNAVLGIAVSSAAATGGIIKVKITAPYALA